MPTLEKVRECHCHDNADGKYGNIPTLRIVNCPGIFIVFVKIIDHGSHPSGDKSDVLLVLVQSATCLPGAFDSTTLLGADGFIEVLGSGLRPSQLTLAMLRSLSVRSRFGKLPLGNT
jgi:hypothetical protein